MGEKRRIEVSITMDELEHRHSHDPGPGLSEIMEAVMRCARGEVQTTSWAGRRVSLAQVQQAFDELERQGRSASPASGATTASPCTTSSSQTDQRARSKRHGPTRRFQLWRTRHDRAPVPPQRGRVINHLQQAKAKARTRRARKGDNAAGIGSGDRERAIVTVREDGGCSATCRNQAARQRARAIAGAGHRRPGHSGVAKAGRAGRPRVAFC